MIYQQLKEQLVPILNGNKVGFFISGGFDSAVLLYTACQIVDSEKLNSEIIIYTVDRPDGSVLHSERVVNYMRDKFKLELPIRIVGNGKLHHSLQVVSGIIPATLETDYVLLGDTQNPAHLLDGPVRTPSIIPKIIQPFFQLTKKETVALMIELGFTDAMTLTASCTESILLKCNECWQCRERVWAFAENKIKDLGTM